VLSIYFALTFLAIGGTFYVTSSEVPSYLAKP